MKSAEYQNSHGKQPLSCSGCGRSIGSCFPRFCSKDPDLCKQCHKGHMVFKYVRLYMPRIWAELSKSHASDWNKRLRELFSPKDYEELYALAVRPQQTWGEDMTYGEVSTNPEFFYAYTSGNRPASKQLVQQIVKSAIRKFRESGRAFTIYRNLYGSSRAAGGAEKAPALTASISAARGGFR